jgi:hypothetical protein
LCFVLAAAATNPAVGISGMSIDGINFTDGTEALR